MATIYILKIILNFSELLAIIFFQKFLNNMFSAKTAKVDKIRHAYETIL